jgi:hypothetical protein
MGYKLEGTIKELWSFEIFFFVEKQTYLGKN